MDIVVIGLASLIVSVLTFFSGFGLGTLLMPVFAIFFPVDMAIAMTGVVHLLNNLFKFLLVGRKADWKVILRFGIPAITGAFTGAWVLLRMTSVSPLFQYSMGGKIFFITLVKLMVAVLLVFFILMEILPRFRSLQFGKDKMIIGGLLSGFFGGLSGIQGALRSAFLVKAGLSKEAFIATGVVIACLVDLSRLSVYFNRFISIGMQENSTLLIVATAAAFAGALLGNLLLKKITFSVVQKVVTVMLFLIAVALGMGLI